MLKLLLVSEPATRRRQRFCRQVAAPLIALEAIGFAIYSEWLLAGVWLGLAIASWLYARLQT